MDYNIFDLASQDTRLDRVASGEYAGPCPGCGGDDRFHVNLKKRGGQGGWMCRSCWPAEENGWGDMIDYLRHIKGMSFLAAKAELEGQLDETIERVQRVQMARANHKSESWQDMARLLVEQAEARLWTPEGQIALDYLRGRGFTEKTIHAAHLGYVPAQWNPQAGGPVPAIVIPWYADTLFHKINFRDIRDDCKPKERYFSLKGSTNESLYLGDVLTVRRGYTTFLTEDEFSALAIAQEAGDLVNVCATAGASTIPHDIWLIRLAGKFAVLFAFDADEPGRAAGRVWQDIMKVQCRRYAPIADKDAADMLRILPASIRTWVEGALEYIVPGLLPKQKPAHAPSLGEEQEIILATACYICGAGGEMLYQFSDDGSLVWCQPCWERLQKATAAYAEGLEAYATHLLAPFGPFKQVTIMRKGEQTLAQRAQELAEEERRRLHLRW